MDPSKYMLLLVVILSIALCNSKKSKISKIKKSKPAKETSGGKSTKKQFLGVPSQKERLEANPVDLNSEGGLGGLGGDMEGIPTGMGAGAEPLGAFEPGNGPPPHALEEQGGGPPNLEEEFGGGPPSFAKVQQSGEENEGFDGHGPPPGPFDPPPGMHFTREEPGQERNMYGDNGLQGPAADMTASMTNNIGAMDKANIQGDRDVAEMVRQYASKEKSDSAGNPFDAPPPNLSEAPFNKDPNVLRGFEPKPIDSEEAMKRRLVKTKGKKKWKKFKSLQKKRHH